MDRAQVPKYPLISRSGMSGEYFQKAMTDAYVLNIHWKDWCWSWNSNTLATWCKELTRLKRPWCWERLSAGGEGENRGWDGWMASPTQWTWVWVDSRSCWWAGRPGMLQFMGSQRVGHHWVTELNWTDAQKVFYQKRLQYKSAKALFAFISYAFTRVSLDCV